MAETFKNQVDALTGFAGTEDDALSDWLTAGAREIFGILPPSAKEKCISLTTLDSSPNSLEDLDGYGEVLSVTRKHADSSGIYYTCRQIPTWAHGRATDSNDMMYYGTVTDPVYYIYSNSLRVAPETTDAQPAQIHHYVMPTVAHGATVIVDFPDEAEYLVALYAACRAIQRLMNNKSSDLPSDISSLVLATVSTSLPSYVAPNIFVLPVAPAGADVSFSEVGSTETFIAPLFNIPTLGTLTSMSIPNAPVSPLSPSFTYTDISVSNIIKPIVDISDKASLTTSAPTYTKPAMTAPVWPSFSSMSLPTAPPPPSFSSSSVDISSLTAPTLNEKALALDFKDANDWINVEEDNEMLGSRISVINAQVSEFNATLTQELNKYNKEKDKWLKDVEVILKNEDLKESKTGNDIKKYQLEVSSYQQQVSAEVNRWKSEVFDTKIQEYGLKYSISIKQYQTDLQNELNEFYKEQIVYAEDVQRKGENFQKDIQQVTTNAQIDLDSNKSNLSKNVQQATSNAIKNYEKEVAEYGAQLQKYTQDVASYQIQVSKEIQRWTAEVFTPEFNEWSQKYQGQLAAYGSDIQKETARISTSLNDYQAKVDKALKTYQVESGYDISKYSAEVQANVQKFQSDLAKNSADYSNNLQKYVSEVQKISADNQSALAKFSQDVANYGAKIQKHSVDYKWLQGQYAQLKQDYSQGIQMLVGGGRPPQQREGEK